MKPLSKKQIFRLIYFVVRLKKRTFVSVKDVYNTIAEPCATQIRERASRFLAYAYPIESVDEVQPIVDALKAEHHSARHHCYAYRLGADGEVFRSNDDGEPSGTAGRPILGQIVSRGLSDVLVVVVRYFGGTLLGVPGLIAAYKDATAEVLNQAKIECKELCEVVDVRVEYARLNQVMTIVKRMGLVVVSMDSSQSLCTLSVSVRLSERDAFESSVRDALLF